MSICRTMNLHRVCVALCAGVLLLGSCQKEQMASTLSLQSETVSKASGRIFISINTQLSWELSYDTHGTGDWLKIKDYRGTGSTTSNIMKYDENTSDGKRSATITAKFSDGTSSSVEFTQRGVIQGGEGTVLPEWTSTPGFKSDVVRGWMELPAIVPTDGDESKIDGCGWVFHNMMINNVTIRNYSIFYDALNFMPRWVAYPLNKTLQGSGKRTDDWEQKDPKVPIKYQPYTERGWGHRGFDRGHMMPSHDRLRDAANRTTFYPTNMTMQDSQLNQNVWAALEGQTRMWANESDTLYVMIGAVPSSKFLNDRGGNRVNVPGSYYKALLSFKKGRNPEYIGVAFSFPNSSYDGDDYNTHKMTIRELEQQVNLDLFVNLPSKYESAETEISPLWRLK